MPEEDTAGSVDTALNGNTVQTPVVASDAGSPPTSVIGEDGTFVADWRSSLPEDIRSEAGLNNVKNLPDIARQLINAQRMIGKDKIALPNENSSESEWDEFYVSAGRPATAADYSLARPEDMPEEMYSTDLANAAQDLFHKIGLTKKQADALFDFNNSTAMSSVASAQQAQEFQVKEMTEGLIKEWGNAFEAKKHLGNVAIEQGADGNEEFRKTIAQKFGNDPDFIRFASNLGSKFAEHGTVNIANVPTPADMQSQISEAMHTDAYLNNLNPDHKRQVALVQRMFEAKVAAVEKSA